MEEDEPTNPADVRPLGAGAEMTRAQTISDAIEQPGRSPSRLSGRNGGNRIVHSVATRRTSCKSAAETVRRDVSSDHGWRCNTGDPLTRHSLPCPPASCAYKPLAAGVEVPCSGASPWRGCRVGIDTSLDSPSGIARASGHRLAGRDASDDAPEAPWCVAAKVSAVCERWSYLMPASSGRRTCDGSTRCWRTRPSWIPSWRRWSSAGRGVAAAGDSAQILFITDALLMARLQ
jgi:hypothetical protein